MNRIIKRIGGWGAAVITTIVLAIIFQTQNVLARLNEIGANIGLPERLSMTFYDLQHLGSLYGIFIAIALAVAFLIGGVVFRFAKIGRPVVYIFAGSVAMLVMLFAMKEAFFDVHLIAGARSEMGIGLQMLAGGVGGWMFAWISQPKTKDLRE
jgi:hypothetical protein